MLQPKRILIDIRNDRFYYKCANDLSWLGFRAIKKFEEYTSEICINNLYDLNLSAKKYDWQLEYTPAAQTVREYLSVEFKSILEANKFRTMLDDDVEKEWEFQGLYEKVPLDNFQKRAIMYALHVKRCALFLEMGLGKSAIGSTIAQNLYDNNLIKKGSVLIVAPKTLHGEENWDGELDTFSNLTMVNLRDDLKNLDNPFADCFIMNSERFRLICLDKNDNYIKDNVLAKKGFECVIFDEATKLKSHGSKIRKCFKEISRNLKYCFLMSGLPAPNSVFQLWGLMSCIGNWVGDSYEAFEQRYGNPIEIRPGVQKYFPRRNAEEEIKLRISPVCMYMSSEQYLKLPTYHIGDEYDVHIQMNKEHLKICTDIEDGYLNILDSKNAIDRDIYVENEIAERSKLLQVYSGFIYYTDQFKNKTPVPLEWNPKLAYILKYLKVDLDDPTNNVIIWTRFREELDMIYKRLSQDYLCAYGMGGMTDKQQQQQLDLWLNNPKCRIMIAHPGAFMYGHTWNKANFTYYSSAVDDNEQYSQSRKRNHRRGQTREVIERKFILKDTLEKDIWNAIVRKIRLDKFLKR